MQRDVRSRDNWALCLAQYLAKQNHIPLQVVYTLPLSPRLPVVPHGGRPEDRDEDHPAKGDDDDDDGDGIPHVLELDRTERHGRFLLGGLKSVKEELQAKNVPLHILTPSTQDQIGSTLVQACQSLHATCVICDFSPLREIRSWMEDLVPPLLDEEQIPLIQVDAHNVVPVWFASPKRQVGARTLRPKLNKLLPEFMTRFPPFLGNDKNMTLDFPMVDFATLESTLHLDPSVPELEWATPGHDAAMKRFQEFLSSSSSPSQGLSNFDSLRNDPNYAQVCSNLSPWINAGHISFQRLALDVRALKKYPNGTASFIEEGIVRRELSDNFLYYSRRDYDQLSTAAGWAQETLQVHAQDEREHVYSLEEFVAAETHDDLWNAAQMQLLQEGTMHGFLRMYWAKKILEWTPSPDIALRTALYLNDRYALDGNDPNGFTGVGWSIMGIHDQGWKEREVFGKIRFMNYAGCQRKFDVHGFVSKYPGARDNAIRVQKAKGMPIQTATKKRKRKAAVKK